MTQPTRGYGVAVCMPRSASASARAMNDASASPNACALTNSSSPRRRGPSVVAMDRHWIPAFAGMTGWRCSTPHALRRTLHLGERVMEVRRVLERSIDGREADIGDLVELVQFLHHHLAEVARRHLAVAARQHLLHDAI